MYVFASMLTCVYVCKCVCIRACAYAPMYVYVCTDLHVYNTLTIDRLMGMEVVDLSVRNIEGDSLSCSSGTARCRKT